MNYILNPQREIEDKVSDYRRKLYNDLYAKCMHHWKDVGFENGHNGDWVDIHQCTKCGKYK